MDSSAFPFNPLDWPLCLEQPRKYRAIAWHEHIPFAMALVQMVKPRILVELGVHTGDSYLSFCQAVAAARLDTKCYGVDTWQGDPQAGYYGEEVLTELRTYHDPLYALFSRLLPVTFDKAVANFADGTIDLLHIDGLHTYEAVKHDWDTWLPKMSSRGVVLFHDINVRESDFGVWKLWEELKATHPHFEFKHCHGLGLVATGSDIPAALRPLLEMKDDQRALVAQLFARLGHELTMQQQVAQQVGTVDIRNVVRDLNARADEQRKAHEIQVANMARNLERLQTRMAWMDRNEALRLNGMQHPQRPLRVLYVSDMYEAPQRYRVDHAVEQLIADDVYVRSVTAQGCKPEWLESFNVVVFFRQVFSAKTQALLEAAKRFNLTTVFDCDDLIFFEGAQRDLYFLNRFPESEQSAYSKLSRDLEKTLHSCDWFLGSTPELVDKASEMGVPGLLHRNVLSDGQVRLGNWIQRFRTLRDSEPWLGYFSGSNTHDEDFRSIEDALVQVFEHNPKVKMLLAGHFRSEQFSQRFPTRVRRVPYLPWNEFSAVMARCHVVLAPVAQISPFTDSKSALKFFEPGILGVPVIASPIAEMRQAIANGQNGWLASSPVEWAEKINEALNTQRSLQVGEKARESVLSGHTAHAVKGRLSELLRGLVKKESLSLANDPHLPPYAPPRVRHRHKFRYLKHLALYLHGNPQRWAKPLEIHKAEAIPLPPAPAVSLRLTLAQKFLKGEGIEIGALQNPLKVPECAKVNYVDVLTKAEAQKHYPELGPLPFVDPTIIDNGQELSTIPDGRWDFCIANHVLEHTRKPLTALRNWLRVLKPGGKLYVAIPDRTNKLDHARPLTKFEHLLLDERAELDRSEENHRHFVDWAIHINHAAAGQPAEARAAELEALGYNIHFHVFDGNLFRQILDDSCRDMLAEIREIHLHNDNGCLEHIAILEKLPALNTLRRKVALVMPVFNAYDQVVRTCESVLKHSAGEWELIAVNDCSTDPRIATYLAELAAREPRVRVLTNAVNGGFVITANNGMKAAAADADVILLNSDVEVTENYLRRIQDTALSTPLPSIVTPFSNNATIFSIPDPTRDNPLPNGFNAEEMQALVNAASLRLRYEMPTAVGFCMYIPRELITLIGYLDEVTYGRGFGEENDYCERAKKNGFKVLICDDQFIFHAGKSSFGAEGHELSRKNSAILEQKHPGYHAAVARHCALDPLSPEHNAIRCQIQRWALRNDPALMIILHADPLNPSMGGTEAHVMDRVAAMRLKRVVIVFTESTHSLTAVEILNGDVKKPLVYKFALRTPLTSWSHRHPEAEDMLLWIAILFGVSVCSCDHLLRVPLGAVRKLKQAGIRYICVLHDFYALCPSFNLLDPTTSKSCPAHTPGGDCNAAVDKCLGPYLEMHGIETPLSPHEWYQEHHALFAEILNGAEHLVAPSECVRDAVLRGYSLDPKKASVISHGHSKAPERAAPPKPKDGLLRVAIIGSVAYPIKGAELIFETVKNTRGAVQWHFFGNVTLFKFQERLEALNKNCVFHGAYARDQVVPLLIENSIDVSLFASIVAETFSFTLSESWMAGVPAIVQRLGAQAERVGKTGFGWIVEPQVPAATVEQIEKLIQNRAEVQRVRALMAGFTHKTIEENAQEYLQLLAPLLRPLHAPAAPRYLSAAAAQFDADEMVSRDKFESSIAEPVSLARLLKPLGQVKLIGSGTVQTLRSSGNDPHLQVKFQGGYSPLFRLDIESPANTRLQMFYTTPESPHFSEDKSVRRWLKKGRNEVFIDLPLSVKNLRLDPGETEGDFALYELEVKVANR